MLIGRVTFQGARVAQSSSWLGSRIVRGERGQSPLFYTVTQVQGRGHTSTKDPPSP